MRTSTTSTFQFELYGVFWKKNVNNIHSQMYYSDIIKNIVKHSELFYRFQSGLFIVVIVI